jgi:hypothetical protein
MGSHYLLPFCYYRHLNPSGSIVRYFIYPKKTVQHLQCRTAFGGFANRYVNAVHYSRTSAPSYAVWFTGHKPRDNLYISMLTVGSENLFHLAFGMPQSRTSRRADVTSVRKRLTKPSIMLQEAQLSKSLFDEDCKFSDIDSGLQILNIRSVVCVP